MKWNDITIAVFSALAIYFTYEEYRNGKQTRKIFVIVLILEGIVVCMALLGLLLNR